MKMTQEKEGFFYKPTSTYVMMKSQEKDTLSQDKKSSETSTDGVGNQLKRKDFSTTTLVRPVMSFEQKRFCIKCKEKEPPVDTVLEIGVNITEGRYNRSDYTCNECYKVRQSKYRNKEQFAEYRHQLEEETVEEFREQ